MLNSQVLCLAVEKLLENLKFSMALHLWSMNANYLSKNQGVLEGRQAKLESLDGKKEKLVQFGEGGFHFRGKEKRGKG